MAAIQVTYYLKNPETRPNPYRLGPNLVFVNGAFTQVIDEAKLASVDKYMANWGATRTPPEQEGTEDGRSEVQEDRDVADGEGEVPGPAGEGEGLADTEEADRSEDANAAQGDQGSDADEGATEGAEASGVTPVARRTKAEVKAGLDAVQAAEFRASEYGDPMAWFEANYPEQFHIAHGEPEDDGIA